MSQKELGRIVKDLFHLFKKEDNPDKESQETIANKAFKEMDVDSDGKVTEEEFVRACLSQETISKMLALKVIDVFIWQERNLAFPNSWWSEEKPMKLKTWFQLILLFTHHLYYSNNYSKKQCSIFSLSPKAVDVWISTALLSPLLLQKIKNTTTKILHVPCSWLCFVAWNIQKTYFDLLKNLISCERNFFKYLKSWMSVRKCPCSYVHFWRENSK